MCGRFTNEFTWAELHALYSIHDAPAASNMQPRYNIAPTQDVDFVGLDKGGNGVLDIRRLTGFSARSNGFGLKWRRLG